MHVSFPFESFDSMHAIEWRVVPGFPDYEVSSLGEVRRITANKWAPAGYVVRCSLTHDGYRKLTLSQRDGTRRMLRAARVVAIAFLGPPPSSRHVVAHRDGAKTNDCIENLRWATPEENEADKVLHGTNRGTPPGSAHHQAVLDEKRVAAIKDLLRSGFSARLLAREYRVGLTTIRDIKDGKTWRQVA